MTPDPFYCDAVFDIDVDLLEETDPHPPNHQGGTFQWMASRIVHSAVALAFVGTVTLTSSATSVDAAAQLRLVVSADQAARAAQRTQAMTAAMKQRATLANRLFKRRAHNAESDVDPDYES